MKRTWQQIGMSFLSIAVLLILWDAVSRFGVVNTLLFPSPSKMAFAWWLMMRDGTLVSDSFISVRRALVGIGIGSATGIMMGLITGRIVVFDAIVSPVIHLLRPLPPVAIIPLVIVWFGIGEVGKIFSTSLAVFFPVWLGAHIGSRDVASEYLWSAALLTQSSARIFMRVIFPAALPFIITGIRTGIAISFVMVFVSELAGAQSGLGYRISVTQLAYRVDQMMAGLVMLAMLNMSCDSIFTATVRRLFPWISQA